MRFFIASRLLCILAFSCSASLREIVPRAISAFNLSRLEMITEISISVFLASIEFIASSIALLASLLAGLISLPRLLQVFYQLDLIAFLDYP